MTKPKQMSIGRQVLFAFGALCLVLVSIGALFFVSLRAIEHRRQTQQARAHHTWEVVDKVAKNVGLMQAKVLQHVLTTDAGEMQRCDQIIRKLDNANARILTDYETLVDNEKERRLYARVLQARKVYLERTEELLVLSRVNRNAEAAEIALTKQSPAHLEYQGVANEMIDEGEENARQSRADTSHLIWQLGRDGGVLIGLSMLITLGTGFTVVRVTRRLRTDNETLQTEITERQRAEELLRRSKERLLHLVSTRLQTVISGPVSRLSQVAGAAAANRNYSVRTIKQSEDELGGLIDAFNEMLGQIQSRDSALREARDKLEERVQERTSELEEEIAERKLVEEALRTSELKFRQLAENIREVFWMTTPDMREMIYVSPAYQEVWGRAAKSLYQNPTEWAEAIVPEDRSRVFEVCHELASSRPSYDIEYRIQRPDGTIRCIRDRGVQVLDDQGQVYRTAGVASDITERKQAEANLEEAHRQLVDASRHAGMAEVATGVLHNVGNVLNSVNVSASLVADYVKKSKLGGLEKATTLLREHSADLGAFLTSDPRGKLLPGYLAQLADHLAQERQSVLVELESLRKNIEHIKDIVAMQQSYAKLSGVAETVKVIDLIEDALRMNSGALTRHEVQVVRKFGDRLPEIIVDRHKVLQILVNLIRNAKYACDESGRNDKQMILRAVNGDGRIKISVADNGVGIPKENLTRIFNHGFTTRKDGHGFGLHSGALAAREMGGSLNAHSEGPGLGACFTLSLPVQHTDTNT